MRDNQINNWYFVSQGRPGLIYCQTRGVRNEKYILLDGVEPTNLIELFDPSDLAIKVTAHTWAIFFQKIEFFYFLIFCSTSYYKKNNAK